MGKRGIIALQLSELDRVLLEEGYLELVRQVVNVGLGGSLYRAASDDRLTAAAQNFSVASRLMCEYHCLQEEHSSTEDFWEKAIQSDEDGVAVVLMVTANCMDRVARIGGVD